MAIQNSIWLEKFTCTIHRIVWNTLSSCWAVCVCVSKYKNVTSVCPSDCWSVLATVCFNNTMLSVRTYIREVHTTSPAPPPTSSTISSCSATKPHDPILKFVFIPLNKISGVDETLAQFHLNFSSKRTSKLCLAVINSKLFRVVQEQ